MKGNSFIYLSADFYKKYTRIQYPEIEGKIDRPYVQIFILLKGVQYAIPLRSSINHPHVFWTDKENKCGIDFSKAVVIESDNYIDKTRVPQLRQHEFNALKGKEIVIVRRFESYIAKYLKAKKDLTKYANKRLVAYSTLQYFEHYL